ncbi:MAG: AAA family ATPase [Methanocalculus sp. MSAO_Arc1]|uniref:minichromosome maintenance protein MCM n=1 Tax=Methanocalculus TaxID=71151 RepID=UPI000FF397C1|nr:MULTISPECIES: minichromosome maintenance protein MCM [unclassified Methanocalculus]MCP1661854.1 replicative DNA helicase Mcm [Methanocalculus sp. AMF5]RQD81986.1 MAG: AAA family ATPase [Methanocalculus sp. MSAO_Arc1]
MDERVSGELDFETDETDKAREWADFLSKKYKPELRSIGREFPHNRSLIINYETLQKFGKSGVKLADELITYPNKVFAEVRDAIRAHNLLARKDAHEIIQRMNIRFVNLPRKTLVRDIRSDQMNTFVSVEGIIRKTTEVRPRIVEAVFRCASGHMTIREQGYGKFNEPDSCGMADCTHKRLELIPNRSKFIDAQKIRIQELPEGLRGGEQPQTLDIDATDDLTGIAAPGDRVIVNGVLKSIQRMVQGTKSTTFDIYLDCNSVEFGEKEFEEVNITEEDEAAILELSQDPFLYRKIAHSIAPTIYGNDDVKEAVSLQLFSGISKEMPDGSTLRGDIHILLVGDPGIAKSQLLRYVVKLSPRGIYTSGKSATSAGLTAAAVKDEFGDGRWTLEAGALVLADMGIAGVDEMDKMQKDDRSSLHEAMEQQTISIAKAGITATLKSRCALLGAANPKLGRFDEYVGISEQINMPPSLLSRFDLIFIMTDKPEKQRDEAIAQHILKAHSVGELIMQHRKSPIDGVNEEYIERELAPVTPEIDPVMFRKYIAYAKRNCFPIITQEAKNTLVDYYMKLRNLASPDKPVPVTARQLEALVRLAEASARTRLSPSIETDDAIRVIRIVDTCLRKVAYDPQTGSYDIDKIATGVSKQSRDLIRSIKETIRHLGDESGTARVDQVIDDLVQKGFSRDAIEKQIDLLLRGGEALSPRNGLIKLI